MIESLILEYRECQDERRFAKGTNLTKSEVIMTCDSCQANIKGLNDNDWSSIPCLAYVLELIIQSGFRFAEVCDFTKTLSDGDNEAILREHCSESSDVSKLLKLCAKLVLYIKRTKLNYHVKEITRKKLKPMHDIS